MSPLLVHHYAFVSGLLIGALAGGLTMLVPYIHMRLWLCRITNPSRGETWQAKSSG